LIIPTRSRISQRIDCFILTFDLVLTDSSEDPRCRIFPEHLCFVLKMKIKAQIITDVDVVRKMGSVECIIFQKDGFMQKIKKMAWICAVTVAFLATQSSAQSVTPIPPQTLRAIVAQTDNFVMICRDGGLCDASLISADKQRHAQVGLNELEEARHWLSSMGFDVEKTNLGTLDGKAILVLQRDHAKHEPRCGSTANACHITNLSGGGRIILPFDNLASLSDGQTLVHEYIHGLQEPGSTAPTEWIREMVPTAIASVWWRQRTGGNDVFPPVYSMVLDREFWDGKDDPGYGKWDYMIYIGRAMGSPNSVAYLAQDEFLNVATSAARGEYGMKLLHDRDLVGSAMFGDMFAQYVAQFNNIETGAKDPNRSSQHLYYGNIAERAVEINDPTIPVELTFKGEVAAFAADPVLVNLAITPAADTEPQNNIVLATVEIVDAENEPNLVLVREHRLAQERLRDVFVIDGNDAPDELGFFRVVNMPPPDEPIGSTYVMKVNTRPLSIQPPTCFSTGVAAEFVVDGFEGEIADNWRLVADNGTVDGLSVTPSGTGKITVILEIDSPITRAETGINQIAPKQTRIELGTFDVVADTCMVRLVMGPALITYVAKGSYTEFSDPAGAAMYINEKRLALWEDGGWADLPPGAAKMMRTMISRNTTKLPDNTGDPNVDEGDFMSQMPKIWADRFSWRRITRRNAQGRVPKRTSVKCPDGGSNCVRVEFSMEGNSFPVTFDAQRRPRVLTMDGQDIFVEYGVWNVRRPPGF
jgi:hypothetical protein